VALEPDFFSVVQAIFREDNRNQRRCLSPCNTSKRRRDRGDRDLFSRDTTEMERTQSNGWLHRLQKGSARHHHVAPITSQEAACDRYTYVVSEKTRSFVPTTDPGVSNTLKFCSFS